MTSIDLVSVIQGFESNDFFTQSKLFFKTLGYDSELHDIHLSSSPNDANFQNFLYMTGFSNFFDSPQAKSIESIHLLHQFAHDDLKQQYHIHVDVDDQPISHFEFMAIELNPSIQKINLKLLADITRAINRFYLHPVYILFKFGDKLSFATIDRRMNKINPDQDVLLKVSLIHEISIKNPHTAHLKLLDALSISSIIKTTTFSNFVELHQAWQSILSISVLTKRFYKEIANIFYQIIDDLKFKLPSTQSPETRKIFVVRLLGRLLFCWFLKHKTSDDGIGLISEDLLSSHAIQEHSDYYHSILEPLFFEILNKSLNDRVEKYRQNPWTLTPFLNGGLFEPHSDDAYLFDSITETSIYLNTLSIPNEHLFNLLNTFESYYFTIEENTPLDIQIAVDPEMLGRIFENLLAEINPETGETARKSSGSYYTPREIVDYMVKQSLINYFINNLTSRLEMNLEVINNPDIHVGAGNNSNIGEDKNKEPLRLEMNLEVINNPDIHVGAGNNSNIGEDKNKEPSRLEMNLKVINNPDIHVGAVSSSVGAVSSDVGAVSSDIGANIKDQLNQLFETQTNPFDEDTSKALVDLLHKVKIFDPACGSGAFPMGVLNQLYHLSLKLMPFQKDYYLKLLLLQNCIYGCDIQEIAIEISKLRCFLWLITDAEIDDLKENRGIKPLPNLEFKFICANSLIRLNLDVSEPQIQITQDIFTSQDSISDMKKELQTLRERYLTASNHDEKENIKHDFLSIQSKLFNQLGGSTTQNENDISVSALLSNWNPFEKKTARFFDSELMFGIYKDDHDNIYKTIDFDVVIGNPPYVRADRDQKTLEMRKNILDESNGYETLWEKWDLYIPFIERGFKLLKPKGSISYIIPIAYLTAKYALKSRNYFLKHSKIDRIDFLADLDIFEASVKNIIFQYTNDSFENHQPLRLKHTKSFGHFEILSSNLQNILLDQTFNPDSESHSQVNLNFKNCITWGEVFYISVGMVLNAHENTAKNLFTKDDLISDIQDEIHSKPYIEGKNIKAYQVEKIRYLEWKTDRCPALIRRPTFKELYIYPKIITGGMTGSILDESGLVANHSVTISVFWKSLQNVDNRSINTSVAKDFKINGKENVVKKRKELHKNSDLFELKYCLAILNSKLAKYFFNTIRRSAIGLYPDDIKQLPIKIIDKSDQQQLIDFVDQILKLKAMNNPEIHVGAGGDNVGADVVKNLEDQINQIIYKIYDLSDEEINLIEQSSSSK